MSEPAAPFAEVRLLRVAGGGIAREARGHDEAGTRAQELETGLIADLHPAAREERDPAPHVRQFGPLGEVELATGRTEAVVEVMNRRVPLFADVAILRDGCLRRRGQAVVGARWKIVGGGKVARRESLRGKHVRRGKYPRTPEGPDASSGAQAFVAVGLFLAAPAAERLGHRAAGADVRIADERRRRPETPVLVLGEDGQRAPVGGNQFERLGRRPEAPEELCVGGALSIIRHAPQE